MESLRTFIAIDVKVETMLKSKWHELKSILRTDSIKWVDEQSIHLTLFFLGDTPTDMISSISKKLECELQNFSSFKLRLQGFGTFGNPQMPKVIWIGLSTSEQLLLLKEKVNAIISDFGFDEPNGKFSPHLTLGRVKHIKSSNELRTFISSNKSEILQETVIDKVIFYQSTLRPEGPIYKPLKVVKLLSL